MWNIWINSTKSFSGLFTRSLDLFEEVFCTWKKSLNLNFARQLPMLVWRSRVSLFNFPIMQPCFRQCCCFSPSIVYETLCSLPIVQRAIWIVPLVRHYRLAIKTASRSCLKVTIGVSLAVPLKRSKKAVDQSLEATFLAANDALDSETFECVHLGSAFLALENGLEVEPVRRRV